MDRNESELSWWAQSAASHHYYFLASLRDGCIEDDYGTVVDFMLFIGDCHSRVHLEIERILWSTFRSDVETVRLQLTLGNLEVILDALSTASKPFRSM